MYLYRLTQGGSSAAINAFNHMIGMVNPPRVVNISIGFTSDDPACLGESALSLATNDLYEAGILPVVAAGNAGHADKYDCTTSAPATAIGALAVGGHGNLNAEGEAEGDEADVRFAGIFADTSRGGITSEEGKARTIIDLTAFAPRSFLFDHVDGYAGEGAGTSYSSPTVAAGAVDFIDFYKVANNGSAFIDNPGAVVANLLPQGDRQYGAVRSSDFYSNLWGAGRFKMRLPSTIGMDAPYAWVSGSACVEAGEVITLPINNGNPLSADVDDFKGVIYWYDRQHQWGIPVDDIDLRLRIEHGAVLVSSLSGAEEKERVYHSNVGGLELWLEIEGYVITADSEGCGQNSMLVYYAYFWEDDDRDDADGPGLEIDAE